MPVGAPCTGFGTGRAQSAVGPFGEQLDAARRPARVARSTRSPSGLAASRADRVAVARSAGAARFGTRASAAVERVIVAGGAALERKLRPWPRPACRASRRPRSRASAQRDRLGADPAARRAAERRHAVLVADRVPPAPSSNAAAPATAPSTDFDILRLREIEARRHAGIARIAPIGLPSRLQLDLDAGAQDAPIARRAACDQRGSSERDVTRPRARRPARMQAACAQPTQWSRPTMQGNVRGWSQHADHGRCL